MSQLERFREANPKLAEGAMELSDPEVKEFVEFVHTSYEIGVEEKLETVLHTMTPEHFDLVGKFVNALAKNPHFFDIN